MSVCASICPILVNEIPQKRKFGSNAQLVLRRNSLDFDAEKSKVKVVVALWRPILVMAIFQECLEGISLQLGTNILLDSRIYFAVKGKGHCDLKSVF